MGLQYNSLHFVFIQGLTAVPFRNLPSVMEIICSGDVIPSNFDVMSLSLFKKRNNAVLCFVNIAKEECSTSGAFASCVISKQNSRSTEARSLLIGLKVGEVVVFGCNVTTVSKNLVNTISWTLEVKGKSE